MKEQIVAQFEIKFSRYLNATGELENTLPSFLEDTALCLKLYRMMVQTRLFDKKAIALQRTGKMGTYPSTLGQEAICVGIGAAMQPQDVLCPYYREGGAQFWRGVAMEEILLYWGGDETGSDFKGPREDFPICVPIASQTLHAAGVALAFKIRNQPRVAVTTIGDGGTSRGDFYESMNAAGTWQLPVVYVVNNNQWAISVPRHKQTRAQTIAQKAIAAGIEGLQVDGNDVLAVTDAVSTAMAKARKGGGPTVIEALTYRLCDHTTADDASRYRPEEEVEAQKQNDPIQRFRTYLAATNNWDESKEKALYQELQGLIEAAVARYLQKATQPQSAMLDYLYATLPDAYLDQYTALCQKD